jgi:hypothetical protein
LVTGGILAVAAGALALGIAYQGDRTTGEPQVVGAGSPSSTTGVAAAATSSTAASNPIEGFFPRSGQGSACLEPVGVDLIDGYAATLTINGSPIGPDQMNVQVGPDGEASDVITASRSLGQYTYGPEDDCPNGEVLRPTDNVMQVCVYRLEEGPDSCSVTEYVFDVL